MKWFRFSLLSLLVMVNVAAVFLWANMTTYGPWFQHGWGWPYQYSYYSDFGTVDVTTGKANFHYFETGALILDAAIGVAATLLAGVSVEWAVRRRYNAKLDRNREADTARAFDDGGQDERNGDGNS
jgi:hypothetical protein